VLTVFSAIFPSNNVLVPLAPNSVFLKLTWGNPSTVSFLLVQIYWLCKHGLTFLIALPNLFSNFQRFSKVSCLYMVLCTIFSAHRNFVYLLIWVFFSPFVLGFQYPCRILIGKKRKVPVDSVYQLEPGSLT